VRGLIFVNDQNAFNREYCPNGSSFRWAMAICSLALNVVLAIYLMHPGASVSNAINPAGDASVSGDSPGLAKSGLTVTTDSTVDAPRPFLWSQIESADYRQYIANLRAVGCRNKPSRDLIAADLAQHYSARVQALWKPKVHEYWRKYENDQPSAAQMKGLMAIDHERSSVFRELFGNE